MSEEDLKKHIKWQDDLLSKATELKLTPDTIQSQTERRNDLKEQLEKLTTCHCGSGIQRVQHTPHGNLNALWCECNQKQFILTVSPS